MPRKISKEVVLEICNKKHNYKYDYSLIDYINNYIKVNIICPIHGIFKQSLNTHKRSGCPHCSSIKLNNESFIEKSNKIHNNKYDYSLVEYVNILTPVKIICKEHGIFEKIPDNHLRNQGCPICSHKKLTTEIFIKQSIEIHNNKYDYSLVDYKNNYTKVNIICPFHGIFKMLPSNHIYRKQGCLKCKGLYRTTEEFINLAIDKHGNKYDYSLVDYIKSHDKVKIICKKHHKIFEQRPQDHLQGNGCPYCKSLTTEEFISKCIEKHNDKYDYSLVEYINSNTKVKIICKKHNKIFEQRPSSHLSGQCCPRCKESKGETKIEKFLEEKNIVFEKQKKFINCKHINSLPFDFYLPDYNMCIEFDGVYHFEDKFGTLENVKRNDNIKNEYCKKHHINLIRISYKENIINVLNQFFVPFKCG